MGSLIILFKSYRFKLAMKDMEGWVAGWLALYLDMVETRFGDEGNYVWDVGLELDIPIPLKEGEGSKLDEIENQDR